MVHSVSGVPTPDGKPVELPLENVQVGLYRFLLFLLALADPLRSCIQIHTPTGLRILTHIPTPSMRLNGSAYPQAEASGLANRMSIGMHYHIPAKKKCRITDFKGRTWQEIDNSNRDDAFTLIRPRMEIMASSAILAVPGAETGELLMAYPSTGISTSQTTETMK